ncbi:RICIN domain-containing protein [Archangium sp.]|uniref:RICIN domain-containing protein n=1 Tax=Archangium sp. TaxID=1872627 RepID=UPI00286B8439|nr:RICIN domain-containing protein [Archangium sp.]
MDKFVGKHVRIGNMGDKKYLSLQRGYEQAVTAWTRTASLEDVGEGPNRPLSKLWHVFPSGNGTDYFIFNVFSGMFLTPKEFSATDYFEVNQFYLQEDSLDEDESSTQGHHVARRSADRLAMQLWHLEYVDDKVFKIKNSHTGKYLYRDPGDNSGVKQRQAVGDDNERWFMEIVGNAPGYTDDILAIPAGEPKELSAPAQTDYNKRDTGSFSRRETQRTLVPFFFVSRFPKEWDQDTLQYHLRKASQERPFYLLKRFKGWTCVGFVDSGGVEMKYTVTTKVGRVQTVSRTDTERMKYSVESETELGFEKGNWSFSEKVKGTFERELGVSVTQTTEHQTSTEKVWERHYPADQRVAVAYWLPATWHEVWSLSRNSASPNQERQALWGVECWVADDPPSTPSYPPPTPRQASEPGAKSVRLLAVQKESPPSSAERIEVQGASGVRVRFAPGTNVQYVASLVKALEDKAR